MSMPGFNLIWTFISNDVINCIEMFTPQLNKEMAQDFVLHSCDQLLMITEQSCIVLRLCNPRRKSSLESLCNYRFTSEINPQSIPSFLRTLWSLSRHFYSKDSEKLSDFSYKCRSYQFLSILSRAQTEDLHYFLLYNEFQSLFKKHTFQHNWR